MKKRNTNNPHRRRNGDYEVKIFHFPETVAHQPKTNFVISFLRGFVNRFGELVQSIRANSRATKT